MDLAVQDDTHVYVCIYNICLYIYICMCMYIFVYVCVYTYHANYTYAHTMYLGFELAAVSRRPEEFQQVFSTPLFGHAAITGFPKSLPKIGRRCKRFVS